MWLMLISLAALTGGICGWIFQGYRSIILGGAIPWFGLLAWLLYNEYFVPYQGGGASMWPIAQLFAGSIVAVVGILAAVVVREVKARLRGNKRP
ncbi:hypothetical protein H6F90_05955 [Trichocoleus sp. FACHB-591]|uniref:hypothetical protein n=1 Tax=Trichocoleus sp. FACHB-591 TaxID=2692872 RepID=UPI0016871952|nr:hypothetical protein [Trichocoleus sp. FACHB-591]MBD2094693.1 hypothetical protein [Trichocoleus sp. FACHB-591]